MKPLLVLLFIITIGFFSYWGYQWVNFVLGLIFNVSTGSTFFDLIIGLVAMVSSVLIFIGAAYAWYLKAAAPPFLVSGSIGFFIKNFFDIINDVHPLLNLPQVTAYNIRTTATQIGFEFLQIGFWIFVLVYFNRQSLKKILTP